MVASFTPMSSAEILDQLRALPAGERQQLVGQIWDEFADSELALTPVQAAELDRRLEDHKRSPNDVVPWSEIKAAAEGKHGRRP
jgi:putative addiction module component (TIGR02574 family)